MMDAVQGNAYVRTAHTYLYEYRISYKYLVCRSERYYFSSWVYGRITSAISVAK
jgi:hypothetical protein